jgi:hypothetical protein
MATAMAMTTTMAIEPKPKIFLAVQSRTAWAPDVSGCAIAEDGTLLAAHVSSTDKFLELDLRRHTAQFDAHYPGGYELIWIGDLAATDKDFREAMRKHIGRNRTRCEL